MVRVQCPHGALAAPAPHSLHRPLSALRASCAFRSTNVCSGLFLPDWLGLRTSGPYGARRASWSGVPPLPGANQLAPLAPQLRLRCGPYVEKRGRGGGGGVDFSLPIHAEAQNMLRAPPLASGRENQRTGMDLRPV